MDQLRSARDARRCLPGFLAAGAERLCAELAELAGAPDLTYAKLASAVERMEPRCAIYGATDTGRRRQANEDAFLTLELHQRSLSGLRFTLAAVADGMGGHASGEVAARLVPAARPGDFNQALMDLGAIVCLPRKPLCLLCPLAGLCKSRSSPENRPVLKPRPVIPHRLKMAAVIVDDGSVLLSLRPAKGLMPEAELNQSTFLVVSPINGSLLPSTSECSSICTSTLPSVSSSMISSYTVYLLR